MKQIVLNNIMIAEKKKEYLFVKANHANLQRLVWSGNGTTRRGNIKVKLELEEIEDDNIHRIISRRYSDNGELVDESWVGYIESRLAELVNFDEMKF